MDNLARGEAGFVGRPSWAARYGVAVLAVVFFVTIKLLLAQTSLPQSPFLLLSAAIMIGAWFGGLGPGLLATALATLAGDYFFWSPIGSFTGPGLNALPLVLFALQGVLISSLVQALRSATTRAESSAREAERHRQSLRQSEERFRLLIEGVEDYAIFMLDPEGRVASWNAGAERINGYREKEIVGEHFSVFYTEENLESGHPQEELRVATSEGRYQEEALRVRKDGLKFWASVLITALRDEEGNLRGFSKVVRDITERKEAEQALQESEQRFRALVQNSSDIITVVDAEGAIRYVSPAVERVTGYRPEELVGKSVFDHVRPDDLDDGRRMFAEVWSQPGVHPPFEFRVPHKDGSWRRSEFILNNLLDDPSVRGVVINQRDVTERKDAERRLGESEELHRAVVEQAAENIFVIDAETKRILEANTAFQASLGYGPEELGRLTLYDIVAHDRKDVERNVRRIMDGGTFSGERVYRRRDGSLIEVEVSASLLSYGGKETICIVAHDVTERNRAEEALRRSFDSLLALYEAGRVLGSSLERGEISLRLLEFTERVSGLKAAIIDLGDEQGRMSEWRSVGPEELLAAFREQPEVRSAIDEVSKGGWARTIELRELPNTEAQTALAGCLCRYG